LFSCVVHLAIFLCCQKVYSRHMNSEWNAQSIPALFSLSNRVALITGGAEGIGAAMARLFAAYGARVVVADISVDSGAAIVDSIRKEGDHAEFLRMDVTSEADWQAVVAAIKSEYGALHILVNNAGVFDATPLGDSTFSDWQHIVRVNQDSIFLGCKSTLHLMASSSDPETWGSIINLSSVAGLVGVPFCTSYSATKGAVRQFSKSLALEYAQLGYNIRVNSLHPGLIDTSMGRMSVASVKGHNDKTGAKSSGVPVRRFGRVEELAAAALFLASDASSYMTGSELVIDGGLTAQ